MNRGRDRLLIFGTDFPPESVGTAAYACALATGMQRRGVQVTVLTRECTTAGSDAFDRAQPFPVIRMRRAPDVPRAYIAAWQGLRSALGSTRPHCLWTTNGMATRVAGLPGIARGLPVISSIRGTDIRTRLPGRGPLRSLESIPQRRCYRRSAAIAAASEYLRQLAISEGVPGERIFVSFSAIPPELERIAEADPAPSPSSSDRPREAARGASVLTVARLTAQKRVDVAIAAMEIVQRTLSPRRVHHRRRRPGTPPPGGGGAAARSAGPLRRCRSRPGPPDFGSIYCGENDLFLLTSSGEGLGNVLLEAAAFGLASVGPRSGGVPEAVLDGDTGLLADAERSGAGRRQGHAASRRPPASAAAWGTAPGLRVRSLFSVDALADRCHPVLESVLACDRRAVAGSL